MNRYGFSFLILICSASTLKAQETTPPPSPTPSVTAVSTAATGYLMDEVVVTSDRLPTPKDQVAGSLTVLTARDLQQKQQTTVAEALREIPGVDVVQDGGDGKDTTISLRGSGAERTLVFVDGVEVNDPIANGGNGAFDFADLTTDNVERIEVLRGSQSALYGPDATGGVVQIFTQQGQGPLHGTFSNEMGSMGYSRGALGVSGGDSWLDYSVQASRLHDDGFSIAAANPSHILPLEADGTQNTVVSSQFGSHPVSFLTLRLIQRYTDAETNVDDGAFDDDPNHLNLMRESILKGEAETSLLDARWQQTLSFSRALNHFEDSNDPDIDHPDDSSRDFYNGRRDQFEWQNNLRFFPHHVLTLGFDNRQEWGDSSSDDVYSGYPYLSSFAKQTDIVNGWYGQDQIAYFNRLFVSAGARWDHHDLFGDRATWRLAPAFIIPFTQTKLKSTLGTGWQTPTLFQRFSEYGNPSLRPERSLSWDYGLEQPLLNNRLHLDAVCFDNRYRDFLDYDYNANYGMGAYINDSRVRCNGVETSFDAHYLRDGLARLSFNQTNAKNEDTGRLLLRRATHRASFSLDSPSFHGARAGFEVLYTGHRQDIVFPADFSSSYQTTLPDYTLARLHADWKPTERVTFFARVENLFDRRYEEILGYQTARRSFYFGSRFVL